MGENNNKPIGFTHIDRPYEAFREFSGAYGPVAFNRKKGHMGPGLANSVRDVPSRPFQQYAGPYGELFSVSRSLLTRLT